MTETARLTCTASSAPTISSGVVEPTSCVVSSLTPEREKAVWGRIDCVCNRAASVAKEVLPESFGPAKFAKALGADYAQ